MSDDFLSREFARRNAETFDNRANFADHRRRIADLLSDAAGAGEGTLCVLGAGNCNDLDLPTLAKQYREITLVDVDASALERGIASQFPSGPPTNVHLLKSDVTGCLPLLSDLAEKRCSSNDDATTELHRRLAVPSSVADHGPQRYDVVVSVCLLSQLIDAFRIGLGDASAAFRECVPEIRLQHLATLLELTKSEGTAILVWDFVSNASAPELPNVPESQLIEYAGRLLQQGNVFLGTHPGTMRGVMQSNPQIAAHIDTAKQLPPWKWRLGSRMFLVTAVSCRKR